MVFAMLLRQLQQQQQQPQTATTALPHCNDSDVDNDAGEKSMAARIAVYRPSLPLTATTPRHPSALCVYCNSTKSSAHLQHLLAN